MASSTLATDWLGRGTHAARPATSPVSAGGTAIYYETDTTNWFGWTGSAWAQINASGGEPSISAFTAIPAFPGFDPLFTDGSTLSSNNRVATAASGSPYNIQCGTPANYTGKRYFEMVPPATTFCAVGLVGGAGHMKSDGGGNLGAATVLGQVGWESSGTVKSRFVGGTGTKTIATIQTWTGGDTLSIAADLDAMLVWFRTNGGNWNNSGANDPATGVGGLDLSWVLAGASNRLVWPAQNAGNTLPQVMHLLAADFTRTVPTGFVAWAT